MHTKTLAAISILLMGVAACGNPKPADPVVTTPPVEATTVPDAAMPGNDVGAMPEATNAITEPTTTAPSTNGVTVPADEPRGLPDRR